MSVDDLEPYVKDILQATPLEDLGTITAKDVRARLVSDSVADESWLKENKKEVNALIGRVFAAVSAPLVSLDSVPQQEDAEEAAESPLDDVEYSNGTEGASATPPPKRRIRKSKRELTDEEYARQLSSELNGRSRSSRAGKVTPGRGSKKGSSKTPKKSKKSAAVVEDSDASDRYSDSESKPKKKRGGGGGAKGGFGKEYVLSGPLSALLEVDKLSRPQVVKQLWIYIKDNSLQNPSNKREILCDDRMRPIFNADKIDMFKMNKVLGQHLHETE